MADADAAAIEDLHSDLLLQALRHLDGASLASVNSATSCLRRVSSHPDLWRRLCLSAWPSLRHPNLFPLFASSPKRFFSDAFPSPSSLSPAGDDNHLPDKIVSAVDLYHHGSPIFSGSIETDTSSLRFRESPFLITGSYVLKMASPEDLSLSWTVINPASGRAVNLSSRREEAMKKLSYMFGVMVVRFCSVIDGWAAAVTMMLRNRSYSATALLRNRPWRVMKMWLTLGDVNGAHATGIEGLRMVKAAMEAVRRRGGEEKRKG